MSDTDEAERKTEIDASHAIIRKAMDDAGIVDYCYVGKTLNETPIRAYSIGVFGDKSYSNVQRFYSLFGMMEDMKLNIYQDIHFGTPDGVPGEPEGAI